MSEISNAENKHTNTENSRSTEIVKPDRIHPTSMNVCGAVSISSRMGRLHDNAEMLIRWITFCRDAANVVCNASTITWKVIVDATSTDVLVAAVEFICGGWNMTRYDRCFGSGSRGHAFVVAGT